MRRVKMLVIIVLLFCISCKTYQTTLYKIKALTRNYYTNDFAIYKDSIMFYEYDRRKNPKKLNIISKEECKVTRREE